MRASGVRGLLVYCSDYNCSRWTAISGDRSPNVVRLSDIEPQFVLRPVAYTRAAAWPYSDSGNWMILKFERLPPSLFEMQPLAASLTIMLSILTL
jgi:hypothetical protein